MPEIDHFNSEGRTQRNSSAKCIFIELNHRHTDLQDVACHWSGNLAAHDFPISLLPRPLFAYPVHRNVVWAFFLIGACESCCRTLHRSRARFSEQPAVGGDTWLPRPCSACRTKADPCC